MISYHQLVASAVLLLVSPIRVFGQLLMPLDRSVEEDLFHRNLGNGSGTNMPLIVTVIDSTTDLTELCYTFQTLVRAKAFPTASIMAFHGLHLSDELVDSLQSCTNRDATFVDITLFYNIFPEGFTPVPGVNYDKQQTERFFVTELWELPHVEAHDVIVRVTDTTCLTYDNYDLPDFSSNLPDGFTKNGLMYQTQTVPGFHVLPYKYTKNLFDITYNYMTANNITPLNPVLWENIEKYHNDFNSLPKWDNTFEIVRKEFMLRRDVADYHHFITNTHAGYFYNTNWSSEVLRYLTLSLFGAVDETFIKHVSGYMEKDFLKGKFYPGVCRLGPFGTPPPITS
mmetsp:Transcript_19534/g.24620  ORF Transcript_19534/g.24620 Transcript_19534/m.24620 type:complete len:340 (-) Transcript_19534:76-1095(-)